MHIKRIASVTLGSKVQLATRLCFRRDQCVNGSMLGLDACVRVLSLGVFICPFHWLTYGILMLTLPELWLLVTDHASLHHLQELRELDGAISVQVHLHHELVELVLGGVLAHGPHHVQKFLRRDRPTAVLSIIPLLQFRYSFWWRLLGYVFSPLGALGGQSTLYTNLVKLIKSFPKLCRLDLIKVLCITHHNPMSQSTFLFLIANFFLFALADFWSSLPAWLASPAKLRSCEGIPAARPRLEMLRCCYVASVVCSVSSACSVWLL